MNQMFSGGNPGVGGTSFPTPGSASGENTTATADDSNNASTGSAGISGNPAAANPFAALLGLSNMGAGAGAGTGTGTGTDGNDNSSPATNPFFNPELLGSLFGSGASVAPVDQEDNRPPEERYEAQLSQLNELGFYDFDRNVRALRRSGGNVQGAVEALLDGQV
jgi:ubiquilin